MAAEYFLPAASVYLAEYAGGTAVAGLLTGLIRGYNGSIFEPSAFDGIDPTAAFLEKGAMCVGTVLSLNLASVAKRGGTAACNAMANLATKELTSAGTNFIAAKVSRSVTWFSSSCARRTAISQTAQKSLQSAERNVIKGEVRVGPQIWSTTKNRTSVQNAFKHWGEHAKEFPELLNSKQYVEASWNFSKNPPLGTLFKMRPNGEILHYYPQSNTFGAFNKEGIPKTMFRPKDYMKYWDSQ